MSTRRTAARVAVAFVFLGVSSVPASPVAAQEQAPTAPQAPATPSDEPIAESRADGRRTLSRLPANFGRGFVGVFSRQSVVPVLAGIAASATVVGFDESLANPGGAGETLGRLGAGLGDPVYVGGLALVLLTSGRVVSDQRWRDATYDVFVAASVNFAYTEALKIGVARTRPNEQNDRSFPSGHTSNAFAWATVLERHYGAGVGIPMYMIASLVGVSRVTGGKHYVTDVIAGAAIGFIVGRSTVRKSGFPVGEPSLALIPIVGPRGQPGLAARLEF